MRPLTLQAAKKIISRFSGANVLVIGDLILDEFVWGEVSRISPEAPVPVVWVKRESFMPGGASNVANNLRSLGAKTHLIGVIGNDQHGATLTSELEQKGIDVSGILADDGRPTIVKTRVVAHHQQVVRIDRERVDPLTSAQHASLIERIEAMLPRMNAIIIEDYGKGVITPRLLKKIIPLARARRTIIAVDPKEEHFAYYRGVSVITPNNHEAAKAVGFAIRDDRTLKAAGRKLLEKLRSRIALITLGENGMAVFQKNKPMQHIPTVAQEVFDVSGAGDTVIATYTAALAVGADPVAAAHIANYAAGIVVGKVGIAVVTPQELTERMRRGLAS